MEQFAVGCLRRVALVCGQFLKRIIRWFHVSYWIPPPRTHPPDTLNHSKWGKHRTIKVHNINLHYVENGASSKPLMLFLHGMPDFWYTWRYQLHEFSRDYWTVAVDLPGCGQSEQPIYSQTYKLSNLANVVCTLVNALGKSECILIGSGTGATLGWHIVNQYPQVVSKYIMLGMPPLSVVRELFDSGFIPLKTSLHYALLANCTKLATVLARAGDYAVFDRLLGPNAKPQDLEAYKYTFAQPTALERAVSYFRENFTDLFLEEYEFRVRKQFTTMPGLFLAGEDDRWIAYDEYSELLISTYEPLETRFVPRVGWLMHQQDPKTVNKIIMDFLRKDSKPQRSEYRPSGANPETKVIVKEVCNNCYGKEHAKTDVNHGECAKSCHGQEHWYHFTRPRMPVCS